MKKILIIAIGLFVLASCQEKQRYTQQSPEIDTYKKAIEAYVNQDWETLKTVYADTAKIQNNTTKDKAVSVDEHIATHKEDSELFTSWLFVDSESEYEMVLTDKGETWVNFWGLWKGILKSNGKEYTIPCAITAQFVDGKIVSEHGYWNNTELNLDILKASTVSSDED